ncbi:MAG: hypothetical protein ACI935_002047 [Moritella dasanensis]|jgi:hypothetical protein
MAGQLEQNKKNAIEFYRTAYLGDPAKDIDFLRAIAEGDLVALHTRQMEMNTSRWIFSGLILMVKSSSIGIQFKMYQQSLFTVIRCFN